MSATVGHGPTARVVGAGLPSPMHRRRAALHSLIDTVALFGAAGWAFVAVIAVFTPEGLPAPLFEGLPLRRDTFGIACFAMSAAAFVVRETRRGGTGRATPCYVAALTTIFWYSSAVAVYLLGNSVSHPQTMSMPLTHLLGWPTEGAVLRLAVLASLGSFFLLRLYAHSASEWRAGSSRLPGVP